MAASNKDREKRLAREREQHYRARKQLHDGIVNRRRRDNVIAGVVGGILILLVVGGQVAFYTVGPGTPAPSPSTSVSPTPTPTP